MTTFFPRKPPPPDQERRDQAVSVTATVLLHAALLGGLLLMHEATGVLEHVLLVIAIAFGTINIVGGFLVTDRMLGMFKSKPDRPSAEESEQIEEESR